MQFKNIVQTTGTYTNKQGEEKRSYLRVWKLIIKDDGQMSIKLDCNPRLDLSDWRLNIYDEKKKSSTVDDIGWDVDGDLPF